MNNKKWTIFSLGTNNWQSNEEFAPGSGILHEGHHRVFNELKEVECYSMWPSKIQRNNPLKKDIQIFPLEHDIPICESVSPNSSYRWHSMSDKDFSNYYFRLLNDVEKFIGKVESEKQDFNLFIAHHAFVNPVIMNEINERRFSSGKKKVPLAVFAHGTALKMYQNELNNLSDFNLRYFPWINKKGIFDSKNKKINSAFVISESQKEVFSNTFNDFNSKDLVISGNGFNDQYFRVPSQRPSLEKALEGIVTMSGEKVPSYFDKTIIFTGKFADWKRLDTVLLAAQDYERDLKEKKNLDVATLVVGTGPEKDKKFYFGMAKFLGLKNTFFLGPQNQEKLAELNAVADIGVYPSKDEPFGLVLLECMACGTPIIGANSGGPKDYVTNDVGELISESNNKNILAQRLSYVVQKALVEDWKKTKGPTASAKAHNNFSLKAQCVNLLKEIEYRLNVKI